MRYKGIKILLTFIVLSICQLVCAETTTQWILPSRLPQTLKAEISEMPSGWSFNDSTELEWAKPQEQVAQNYDGLEYHYLFRTKFRVDSLDAHSPLYVFLPPTRYALRAYLNGHLFIIRGDADEHHATNIYHSSVHVLSPQLLNYGSDNEIVMFLTTYTGNRSVASSIKVGTLEQGSRYVLLREVFNVYVPFTLFVVGILVSIFFMVVLFTCKGDYKKRLFLITSVLSLSCAFAYVDYAFNSSISPVAPLVKVTSIAMWSALLLSLIYVCEYFDVFNRWRPVHRVLLGAALLTSLVYIGWVIYAPSFEVANFFNSIVGNLALPTLLVCLVIALYHTVRKPQTNRIALTGAIIVVAAGLALDINITADLPDIIFTPAAMLVMLFVIQCLFVVEFENLLERIQRNREELKQQKEEMELTVQMRTHDLRDNNQKLNATMEKLRNLNDTRNRFFSIMAHDIKNPLGAIMGFSDLLIKHREDFSEEDRIDFVRQINTGAYGLYKMLENLLEWSRAQVGSTRYTPSMFKMNKIRDALLPIVSGAATTKGIVLKFDYADDMEIYGDSNMTTTICRNLITNSIKFSYPGGEVRLTVDDSPADYYELVIADQGVGMTQEKINRLFQIDKVESTLGTNQETGSGIGLILCNEFISRQHGSIKVESEVGKGSRFIVHLPKKSAVESMPTEDEQSAAE